MLIHFIYCRKSSEDEERQVISNESQQNELNPIAARDCLTVKDILKEEASAKSAGTRARFNDMVARIKKGEANAILCWHLNRLSRNAIDAAVLVDLMDQGKLIEIRTPGQTFKNSPGDKFLITLFCSQAKLENDNKGEDVKRGLKAKATMGWYPGVAPIGYLNDKTKNRGERELYNDPDRFVLIKRMWQLMLTGTYTPPQILKIANEKWGFRTRKTKKQGGMPLSRSGLYHILHNPFYYGWYEYPVGSGKWYEGKHEPMISKAEYNRVQMLLGRNGNTRAKERVFAYTGLIRCGTCPGTVTAEIKHQVRCTVCRRKFSYIDRDSCPSCSTRIAEMSNPKLREYVYYHCSRRKAGKCRQGSVELKQLEKEIQRRLERIQISARFNKWAWRYLQEVYRDDVSALTKVSSSRERAIADSVKRLENLLALKTSPGNADGSLLSEEEYSKLRRELLQTKAALDSPEAQKLEAERALHQSEETFEFAYSALNRFIHGNVRDRKEVLAVMGSNHALKGKTVVFEPQIPFVLIDKFKSINGGFDERIEPEKIPAQQGQNGQTESANLRRLWDVDDDRTNLRKIRLIAEKVYSHFRMST